MNKNQLRIRILLAGIAVILIWLSSWGIIRNAKAPTALSDQAALLFGASSIALFVLSLVVAILAVFGWQSVKEIIKQKVEEVVREKEEATERKVAALEAELRGRTISVLGHTLGLLSTKPDQLNPLDSERLDEAVQICQAGYDLLAKVGGPAEFMALNNLVYYSCILGDDQRARYLIEQARILRDAGQKHNAANLLLTYCRAALHYGSEADISEATQIAKALLDKHVSKGQLKEASFYLASLAGKMPTSKSQNLGAPGIQDTATIHEDHSVDLLSAMRDKAIPKDQGPNLLAEEPQDQ